LAEKIQFDGVNYRLIDTAGVRETKDQIESQGVERSLSRVKNAFFRILLINPFETDDQSFHDLLKYDYDMIFFTHADLEGFEENRQSFTDRFCQVASGQKLNILSLDQSFIDNILKLHINKKYLDITSASPILLDRHKSLILQLNTAIQSYRELAQNESDIAIIGSELNTLGHCISELIGIISPDQVLDSIFSNFCIGK
jgi:tRNA modification GTPase